MTRKHSIVVDHKKHYALDYFLSFDRDREAYLKDYKDREKRRKYRYCENHILRMLSEECLSTRFWCRCEYYPSIRNAVLAKLKQEKVIETSWFIDPVHYHCEKVYCLNLENERARKILKRKDDFRKYLEQLDR